jgi:hypothetical protein
VSLGAGFFVLVTASAGIAVCTVSTIGGLGLVYGCEWFKFYDFLEKLYAQVAVDRPPARVQY